MKFKLGTQFYLSAFLSIVLITHVIMLFDSMIRQVYACTIQNAIGCIVITILYLTKKKSNPFVMIFFILLHLELQVFIAIFFMGWKMQFQYYYLGIMVFSVLMSFPLDSRELTKKQKFLGISSTVLFFSSYIISRNINPLYTIPEKIEDRIALLNYISIFSGLAFLSNLFRMNAIRFAYMMRNQSLRDELTKLYNRRGIRAEMDRAIDAMQTEGIPYAVAIFDIDDFKLINDTYGHDMGDEVLKKIGKILQDFENEIITACRWGGEEFLLIRQNSIYKESMEILAHKIAGKISQLEFNSDGTEFKVTVTAGCANSDPELSLNETLKIADNRLYHGKQTGKNKIVSYDINQ